MPAKKPTHSTKLVSTQRDDSQIRFPTLYSQSNPSLEPAHNQPAVDEALNSSSNHTSSLEPNTATNGLTDRPSASPDSNETPTQRTHDTDVSATPGCPYHGPILRLEHTQNNSNIVLRPMDLFMSDNRGSQPSLFIRPDDGQLSTSKRCTCVAPEGLELVI